MFLTLAPVTVQHRENYCKQYQNKERRRNKPNQKLRFIDNGLNGAHPVGKKTGQRKKQRNQSKNRCPFVKARIQGRVCGGIQRVKLILQCFTLLVHKKEFAEHSVQLAALLLCGDLKQVKLTLESNKAFLKLVQGNNVLRIDFLLWVPEYARKAAQHPPGI